MEGEYLSICTVLGLKCCQDLKKFCQCGDESENSVDFKHENGFRRLSADKLAGRLRRVQRFRLI